MGFHLKQGDRRPHFPAQLLNSEGTAEDLTGATTVQLKWTEPDGTARLEDMTVTNATEGRVLYAWQVGDTDEPGRYQAEIVVTWPTGEPQTFPAQGYFSWFVHPATGIAWADVLGTASELSTVSDEAQFNILAHVNTALDPDYFGGEGHPSLRLARIFMAAHIATNAKNGASGAAGPVISETLGPASRTYGWSGASSLTGFKELDSTPYGKQLRTLMRASPNRGPFVA